MSGPTSDPHVSPVPVLAFEDEAPRPHTPMLTTQSDACAPAIVATLMHVLPEPHAPLASQAGAQKLSPPSCAHWLPDAQSLSCTHAGQSSAPPPLPVEAVP